MKTNVTLFQLVRPDDKEATDMVFQVFSSDDKEAKDNLFKDCYQGAAVIEVDHATMQRPVLGILMPVEINTQDVLRHVLALTQNTTKGGWVRIGKELGYVTCKGNHLHSTNPGDIFMIDGEFYLVGKFCGFGKIQVGENAITTDKLPGLMKVAEIIVGQLCDEDVKSTSNEIMNKLLELNIKGPDWLLVEMIVSKQLAVLGSEEEQEEFVMGPEDGDMNRMELVTQFFAEAFSSQLHHGYVTDFDIERLLGQLRIKD